MNLVVDSGNTINKAAVFQEDVILRTIRFQKEHSKKALQELLLEYPGIERMIISNVSAGEIELPENFSGVEILDISTAKLPFKNLYATPNTLGNDRKALVAAATKQFSAENVLIIDAGSCITYDFKTSKNEYHGGAISPGLQMRFKALHHFTAKLPLVQPQENPRLTGDTTASSIASGVILGVVKEIDGFIEEYAGQWDNLVTIITGGDSEFLSVNLKNSIFANSNFLLEGLNHILQFNSRK